MRSLLVALVVAFASLSAGAVGAAAQSTAPVGVRAAGMGGAFTAVADDGTAPYWNPAGLAAGALAGLTIDVTRLDRQSGLFAGLATPPLGLSYFRTATSTGPRSSGRNGSEERVIVHHAGVTLVQSLNDHGLAIGATIGAVRGNGATAFNADAGVMLTGALAKIGVSIHNLSAPSLGDVRLDRQVRAGVAVNARQNLLVAADADLTTRETAIGRWRDAAVGLEARPRAGRVWLRSGVHWNTNGAGGVGAAPIGSVGGGVAVYGALRLDAQVSFGSKNGDRGWGAGLGFTY